MILGLWLAAAGVLIIALASQFFRGKAEQKWEDECGKERQASSDRGGPPYTGDPAPLLKKFEWWRTASNLVWAAFGVLLGASLYLTPATLSFAQSVRVYLNQPSAPF